jgi:hypothetical protein
MEQNTTNWVRVRRVTSEEGHKELVVGGIIYFKQLEDNSRGDGVFLANTIANYSPQLISFFSSMSCSPFLLSRH